MNTTQRIVLDFGQKNPPITVWAKQGDNASRFIEITPLNCGREYILESGVTAEFRVTKHDKKVAVNTAIISNGTITVELTKQILAAAGKATAEIALLKGAEILSTQTFSINIEKSAYNAEKVESSDEYKSLIETLKNINNLNSVVADAQKIIGSFKVAAGMVNIMPNAANTPTSVSITFPEGLFSTTPAVTATAHTSAPGTSVTGVAIANCSKTGCDIVLTRTNLVETTISWQAIQV